MPLVELFALLACHSWSQGMDVAGETYEDRVMTAILLRQQAEHQ